ncbi:hypothetical protein ACFSDD_08290 [Salipiger marinus]|jgi:hypothetical protein|uniref:hypothetical protein n=1 Tax=Salipiger marinus TaxID=555512 RepID=UPI000E8E2CD6|nr:hypothetical protein [Salipiger manganoxidans]MCD1619549.1 hypothetical protein [Salipiger manganoxidans]MEB3419488.1 hypothetical protein [Salipiger manganoxidans]HBM60583.1 peptide chain release factor 1 [Citreicella sp.]|tara:strand:+ start:191 stop:505 length:315 start_codon:yes stop_codon:yes gene_type:complete
MQDIYVDTVTAINFNNGIVRMIMVDQDPDSLADGVDAGAEANAAQDIRLRKKQQVIMPLNGFLYMVSVIKGLVDDPKMQDIISRHAQAGLLPGAAADQPRAPAE